MVSENRALYLMKMYSLKMGPMVPGGGQSIFSMSKGMMGFPSVTDKLT